MQLQNQNRQARSGAHFTRESGAEAHALQGASRNVQSRKLVVLVGTRKALAMAVKRVDSRRRVTSLRERLVAAVGQPAKALQMPALWEPDVSRAAEEPPEYGTSARAE
jgi:hypothetical protein